ncbi:MAG: type II toxin-antitoxin system VapC family toxin [Candidatus Dormibacteraeota bacterium]|uniref:Ribonuclease VapC n=1 Tax=Candidatus Amunia macphersoniae TaxID=3127014 RepID=A0A934KKF0_9BACT|nr:type II toxin-antitoxin system VapC family toxin [Candidatus Dormibacteraeota bacterium]
MIVDTSALIAILRDEADADSFMDALSRGSAPLISAGTYLETAIVVDSNRDPVLSRRLDDLLAVARITVEPATRKQVEIAHQAYRDFGKGSGHPAGLNFGDCFAYALARDTGEPLLFKGSDFGHTDVASAL